MKAQQLVLQAHSKTDVAFLFNPALAEHVRRMTPAGFQLLEQDLQFVLVAREDALLDSTPYLWYKRAVNLYEMCEKLDLSFVHLDDRPPGPDDATALCLLLPIEQWERVSLFF